MIDTRSTHTIRRISVIERVTFRHSHISEWSFYLPNFKKNQVVEPKCIYKKSFVTYASPKCVADLINQFVKDKQSVEAGIQISHCDVRFVSMLSQFLYIDRSYLRVKYDRHVIVRPALCINNSNLSCPSKKGHKSGGKLLSVRSPDSVVQGKDRARLTTRKQTIRHYSNVCRSIYDYFYIKYICQFFTIV